MSQYTYCIVTKGTGPCIAIHCCVLQQEALAGRKPVSQYKTNCIVTGLRNKGWAVLQYNTASPGNGRPGSRPCACDTTIRATTRLRGSLRHGAGGQSMARATQRTRARARRYDTAAWSCDTAGGLGHDTARPSHDTTRPARAWACLCAPGCASWANWVLVHLTQFFLPGFRLSTVSESPFGLSS